MYSLWEMMLEEAWIYNGSIHGVSYLVIPDPALRDRLVQAVVEGEQEESSQAADPSEQEESSQAADPSEQEESSQASNQGEEESPQASN